MSAPRRIRHALGRIAPAPFTDWNHKRIGAVSLALVVAVVVGALLLTSNIFSSAYTVNARFSNAVGLNNGDQVLLAGVAVGKVEGLSVQGDHVVAQLQINDGVQLPSDTTAAISVETILGVIGVNLQPGGNWGRLLHDGSTISNTSVPFEFFQVQTSAGNLLSNTDAQALGQVVSALANATSGDRTQIHQIINGLSKITGAVDAHKVQAGQLISAAETLSATLASKDKQLATVVDDLYKVVTGLANRSGQLGRFISATEQAAAQTASLIGRNQPKLQSLLTSLHAALQTLGAHQLDLARSVSYAAGAIKGFSSISQSGTSSPPWANIYADIVGSAVGYEVLGSCGALDEALNVALGPDPLPCSARTGPIPSGGGSGGGQSGGAPASSLYSPLTKGTP